MLITAQRLLQIIPNAGAKAGIFLTVLNTAMGRSRLWGGANASPLSLPRSATSPVNCFTSAKFGGQLQRRPGTRAGQTLATPLPVMASISAGAA